MLAGSESHREGRAVPPDHLLFAFVVATAAFAFVPGPSMLYAAARTVAAGRRAGLMASLGLHCGGYVHIFAAAAGLTLLLEAVPTLYVVVKLAGAAYLVWIGVGMLLNRGGHGAPVVATTSARRAFVQSVVVEVFNPKTAIFYVAFVPQFTDPAAAAPVWMQFVVLGAIVNVLFGLGDLVAVMLAGLLSRRFAASSRVAAWTNRVAGAILVGLGLRLAVQRV